MICLVYSQSARLCMATLFLYTCILRPLLQVKRALLGLSIFLFTYDHGQENSQDQVTAYLSVTRFEDLEMEREMETCSICLVEFEKEDVVSQLSRCGHVFHVDCMERWIDCNQFTCPLCRSFLLVNLKSSQPNK